MADIFISYAHEDEERVGAFALALEQQGWSVFWDRRIPTGQTWRSYIGQALIDARCVIVVWSKHSVVSKWVIEEADDGQSRGILVPVLLDPVTPPIGFRSIQAASIASWNPHQASPSFQQLVTDISTKLGRPLQHPGGERSTRHGKYLDDGPKPNSSRATLYIVLGALLVVAVAAYKLLVAQPEPSPVAPPKVVDLPASVKPAEGLKRKPVPVEQDLPSGHVVVFDGFKDYDRSGFDFASAALVPWNSGKADILVSNNQPPWPQARLFAQNETSAYATAPQDRGANSGVRKMPNISLEEVKECPASDYQVHWIDASTNGVYCVRMRDGKHFAKIKLTDVESDRIAFDWTYQPSGSRRFE